MHSQISKGVLQLYKKITPAPWVNMKIREFELTTTLDAPIYPKYLNNK